MTRHCIAKGSSAQLYCVGILLLLWCMWLSAKEPGEPPQHYVIDEWSASDGLPHASIRDIKQTPNGYLWLATPEGPVCFDGIEFSSISLLTPTGNTGKNKEMDRISKKEKAFLHALLVGKNGDIWIGGANGLSRYNVQTGQVTSFTKENENGQELGIVTCITEDKNGNIWVACFSNYIARLNDGKFTRFDSDDGLEGKIVYSILEDSKGNIWCATVDKGLFILQGGERFEKYPLPVDYIDDIYEDRQGRMWAGTNNGLYRLSGGNILSYTIQDGLSDNRITDILEDSNGNLWIGTTKGLNRMKENETGKISFEKIFEDDYIICLCEDNEKNIWVGTDDSGLKRIKEALFQNLDISYCEKMGEIPVVLFEDSSGDNWVGTDVGTLYRFRQGEQLARIKIPGNVSITAIAEDNQGNLWLGTRGRGIFVFPLAKESYEGKIIHFSSVDGLAHDYTFSILKDTRDQLWFGTLDGLSRYRGGVFDSYKTGDIVGKTVHSVYEDSDRNIWLATSSGVGIIKKGDPQRNGITAYLKGISVYSIYLQNDSKIAWLATYGAGLIRAQGSTFTYYTLTDGLNSNFIFQVLGIHRGYLWMTSDSGVLRINSAELNEMAEGQRGIIDCSTFGIEDGMRSSSFYAPFSKNSVLTCRSGEFHFITKKGISCVNPGKIRIEKNAPPIIIEKFTVDDRSIPLHPRQPSYIFQEAKEFRFHFSAPTLTAPRKVKFKYQLEGYDTEQHLLPAGTKREIRYRKLSAGTYTFRVTGCNNDGVWNQQGDFVTFTLDMPFYRNINFNIALVGLFLVLIIAYHLFSVSKHKKKDSEVMPTPQSPDASEPTAEGKETAKSNCISEKECNVEMDSCEPQDDSIPSLDCLFVDECTSKLVYLMEIEKIYRDENISLQVLAEKLSLTPHQLSRLLNQRLGKSFSDFINTYRIEEARRILRDPQEEDRKILSIAFAVGFNTKAAFNSAFKKYTGMPPSRYRKLKKK